MGYQIGKIGGNEYSILSDFLYEDEMNYFLQGLTLELAYVAPIGLQINSALTYSQRRVLMTAFSSNLIHT